MLGIGRTFENERLLRWVVRFGIPCLVALAVTRFADYLVETVPMLNGPEVRAQLDQVTQSGAAVPNPEIVIVGIEKDTLAKLHAAPELTAVPRRLHAKLLDGLDRAGAKVALVDLEFDSDVPDQDKILRSELTRLRSLKVTLSTIHDDESTNPAAHGHPTDHGYDGRLVPVLEHWPFRPTGNVAVGGEDNVVSLDNGIFVGGYALDIDTVKGITILNGALTATLQSWDSLDPNTKPMLSSTLLTYGSHQWSVDENGGLRVRWTATANPFKTFEYSEALRMLSRPETARVFKDKIVLLGDLRGGDVALTQPFQEVPGAVFVAQTLNTALLPASQGVHPLSRLVQFGYTVVLAFACFALTSRRSPIMSLIGLAFIAVTAVLPPLLVHFLGTAGAGIAPVLATVLAGVLGLLAGSTFLGRSDLRVAGREEEATAMFVDIQDSTPLVAELGAPAFARLIAEFALASSAAVSANGGHIERTLGDGFIAIFAGRKGSHHAARALRCATELQGVAQKISANHSVLILVTIGIETGIVSGAYVTEGGQRAWSTSGRAVILAQRLQSRCKSLGVSVAVGPTARSLSQHAFTLVSLGAHSLKGFEDAVEISSMDQPFVTNFT